MAGTHIYFLRLLTLLAAAVLLGACGGGAGSAYLRRNEIAITDSGAGFREGTIAKLDGIISAQADKGAIRSGAIVIRRRGERVYANSWGTTAPSGPIVPVTTRSPFDVASLTKPMAGVPCACELVNQASPMLLARIPRLLNHTSGFDDAKDFPEDSNLVALRMADLGRRSIPDSKIYRYANANYLYLTWVAHGPLMANSIANGYWKPLGLTNTAFAPIPREANPVWSGETRSGYTLIGEPYDPIADALLLKEGPPVGHSGLFSSAEDVALFAESLLVLPPKGSELTALSGTLLHGLEELQDAETGKPIHVTMGGLISATGPPYAPAGSPPGRYLHHTGYTGCLMWVDTQEGVTVALLTNAAATKSLPKWQTFSAMILKAVQEGTKP